MSMSGTDFLRLSRRILKCNVSNPAKVFYFHLLLNSGSADFYVGDICEILNCSNRTVVSVIGELIDNNLISRERHFGSASHYEVIKS